MSYFWTAIVSGRFWAQHALERRAQVRDARCGRVVGVVGEDIEDAAAEISSRRVMVARRYASLTATIVKSGASTR